MLYRYRLTLLNVQSLSKQAIMNKPTNHTRISWDDNATSLASPTTHPNTTDSDINDTTEDDDIDEFRIRSPGNRSPVTFYIESESSKVGNLKHRHKHIEMILYPGLISDIFAKINEIHPNCI